MKINAFRIKDIIKFFLSNDAKVAAIIKSLYVIYFAAHDFWIWTYFNTNKAKITSTFFETNLHLLCLKKYGKQY